MQHRGEEGRRGYLSAEGRDVIESASHSLARALRGGISGDGGPGDAKLR